jgi:phosphoglycerate-specific signal transduction histidine kinase
MALPLAVGKPGPSGFLGMRLGVRSNFFAAFAVIAGMAVIISVIANILLGQLGEMMVDLAGQDIPRLAASLQLSSQSASLASEGPALLASGTVETLQERSNKMQETQEIAVNKLGEIIELGADKDVISALSQTVKDIGDAIKALGIAARQRLDNTRNNTMRSARPRPTS